MGFEQTASDLCLYTSREGEMSIVGVYVDDILLACKSGQRLAEIQTTLASEFDI